MLSKLAYQSILHAIPPIGAKPSYTWVGCMLPFIMRSSEHVCIWLCNDVTIFARVAVAQFQLTSGLLVVKSVLLHVRMEARASCSSSL
jgi:hypothetical protein